MLLVDQGWIRGLGAVDPRPCGLGAARVECHAHHLEPVRVKLLAELPPAGEIEAASAPRCPRDEQRLAAAQRAQRELTPVAVGQDDVGQLRAGERRRGVLWPERPQAVPLVVDQCHPQPACELAHIEWALERHAYVAAARTLRLDRPAGIALELCGRLVEALEDHAADGSASKGRT